MTDRFRWKDPKGKLNWKLPRDIRATVKDNRVSLMRAAETRGVKALHGLSRSLVHNMVEGVSAGLYQQLEIEGVGFKAAVQGSNPQSEPRLLAPCSIPDSQGH